MALRRPPSSSGRRHHARCYAATPALTRTQDTPDAAGVDRRQLENFLHLSLGPGHGRQAEDAGLRGEHGRVRPYGARRADQGEERDGPDAHLPPLVPRGHLRLVRDEHRRHQHARLPLQDLRRRSGEDLPAAAHVRPQGFGYARRTSRTHAYSSSSTTTTTPGKPQTTTTTASKE